MITCKEVAGLLSSEELQRRGVFKRLEVRFHLWMCRHCSLFARQLGQLRSAARKLAGSLDREAGEDFEARLLRKLRDKDG